MQEGRSPYTLRNEDFINRIEVVCPKCKVKAVVTGGTPYAAIAQQEAKVAFACTACAYALKYGNIPTFNLYTQAVGKERKGRVLWMNAPVDPFFGFDLWYRIETKFGLIWAYNTDHLRVIEGYIEDLQRNRMPPYRNNSIASRLPKWVKEAKNREYLIRMIGRWK